MDETVARAEVGRLWSCLAAAQQEIAERGEGGTLSVEMVASGGGELALNGASLAVWDTPQDGVAEINRWRRRQQRQRVLINMPAIPAMQPLPTDQCIDLNPKDEIIFTLGDEESGYQRIEMSGMDMLRALTAWVQQQFNNQTR